MAIPDWFDWTAGSASIAGLGYAWWASRQATGAKRAAEEAREAVYRRNAADAMVEIVRVAEQLSTSILYERRIEATMQLRELLFRIPKEREEFAVLLASDADKLRDVESSCKLWADFLGRGEFPLNASEKRHLFNETLSAVQELSAIQGRLRSAIDQEGR